MLIKIVSRTETTVTMETLYNEYVNSQILDGVPVFRKTFIMKNSVKYIQFTVSMAAALDLIGNYGEVII